MTFPNEPTQLALEISPEVQKEAWLNGQTADSNLSHWQIYLNQICLQTLLPWLQSEQEPQAQPGLEPGRWVNGTSIILGEKRLVVIPDKSLDHSELRVPQEWVDIPHWVADYYLAVQVNLEGDYLRVWGYATHDLLKTQGNYDAQDRTYSLCAPQLIEDLTVLWVVRQLYPDEITQTTIAPLTALPDAQLPTFLAQLPKTNLRLNLPLNQWNAFLGRSDWMQQLNPAKPQPNNLSQWFENLFALGWETVDAFFGNEPELAYSFRRSATVEPQIRRVKAIHLTSESLDQRVLLLISLVPESDGRIAVQGQLLPIDRLTSLPNGLQLIMLSSSGDLVQAVESREQDDYIQLKTFRCAAGTQFSLQVAIPGFSLIEGFIT
jgi:hypothetical protein